MSGQPAPPRRRGVDAIALTLTAIGLFLLFSLFTHNESNAIPLHTSIGSNPLSTQVGHGLLIALGLAAYAFLAAWLVIAAICFGRPRFISLARKIVGWSVLVAVAAIGLARFGAHEEGLLTEKGGVLGAAGAQWLEQQFSPAMAIGVLVIGTITGTYLVAEWIVRLLWRILVMTLRAIATLIESILLGIAGTLEAFARASRRLARPITRALHPERLLPITRLESNIAPSAIIPITHHQRGQSEKTREQEPFIAIFPRSERTKNEPDPVPERPYDLPSLDLLEEPVPIAIDNQDQKLVEVAARLEKACADFGLVVKVVGIHTGPVITQYEISLDTGLRVSKITSLSDDLALHLKVASVRIIAPIPGKNTVGVEVPNEQRAVVRMKELATAGHAKIAKSKLPLLLGKDSEGRVLIHDLADMPHLLIAGRTGTGKSVCLNSIILSLLMTRRPDECKLIMIDPKQVELAEYGRLPHLMHPVVTDNKKAEAILAWAVDKMEERYEILRRTRVRNISGYNDLSHDEILRRVRPVDEDEQQRVPPKMPYIVIVVDEVGDLMMAMKKEVEGHIIRLAQKSRAAGIHLILTTQRPTVDVITGLIKSNLPARICFQVADRSNSRVVLDEMGAEKLLGKGDMLFLQPNTSQIVRAQGAYASDEEILRVVQKLEVENPAFDTELLHLENRNGPGGGNMIENIRKRDEVYEEAIEVVVREGRGSVSLLQRALGIGYGRAARLIDFMAEDGIVGNYNGAQAREVLFTPEKWEELRGGGGDPLAESA